MIKLTECAEWQELKAHKMAIEQQTMQKWFVEDPLRFERFSLQLNDILFDYSKNRITATTIELFCKLANAVNLEEKIAGLFAGKLLNSTEQRPALHTALRNRSAKEILINGKNIMPEIHAALAKMHEFSEQVRKQEWLGSTGKPIRDIVNIGIGGSHLGPLMATHALADFATDSLRCYFISNIDSAHLNEVLKKVDPEVTLFIISSKSFTTLETLTNARTIQTWLQQKLGKNNLSNHFVAVTANPKKAQEFGIPLEQIFPLWDWVGGRYSVWSAVGLPLILMIGMDPFLEFLKGGYKMDEHFREAPFAANMPFIMALLGIWYINFFGATNHAIVPYTYRLNYFRTHLQQLDMESNGKRVTHDGAMVDYSTGPIIWGEHGCDGQHAFHQLLHQGQHLVPVDFILVKDHDEWNEHNDILMASAFSQAEALLKGNSYEQLVTKLIAEGLSVEQAKHMARHKSIPGNRPSNILFLNKLTPESLGALLALYEHKIFIQGIIWNVNSFDQWGVELGKQLLPRILNDFNNPMMTEQYDASTSGLIKYYKRLKQIQKELL